MSMNVVHAHPVGFPEHPHPHDPRHHEDFTISPRTGEHVDWSSQDPSVFSGVRIPKRFIVHRLEDESGVSGTGVVAVGVQWPTGKCTIEWIVEPHTQGMYDSIEDVIKIHGHNGKTVVMWMADETVLQ